MNITTNYCEFEEQYVTCTTVYECLYSWSSVCKTKFSQSYYWNTIIILAVDFVESLLLSILRILFRWPQVKHYCS